MNKNFHGLDLFYRSCDGSPIFKSSNEISNEKIAVDSLLEEAEEVWEDYEVVGEGEEEGEEKAEEQSFEQVIDKSKLLTELDCLMRTVNVMQLAINHGRSHHVCKRYAGLKEETESSKFEETELMRTAHGKCPNDGSTSIGQFVEPSTDAVIMFGLRKDQQRMQCQIIELRSCLTNARELFRDLHAKNCKQTKELRQLQHHLDELNYAASATIREPLFCLERYQYLNERKCEAIDFRKLVHSEMARNIESLSKFVPLARYKREKRDARNECAVAIQFGREMCVYLLKFWKHLNQYVEDLPAWTTLPENILNFNVEKSHHDID